MLPLDDQQQAARDWFEALRDRICAAFEAIEDEYAAATGDGPAGRIERLPWSRPDASGGGGVIARMSGRVFEKTGIMASTTEGVLSPEFRSQRGGDDDPRYWASSISLICHMRSPKVPAVHMNTRHFMTGTHWFGGGADLTPMLDRRRSQEHPDSIAFHAAMQAACDAHRDVASHARFKDWCDQYFFLKHRGEPRGIGGIFFDDFSDGGFERSFEMLRAVGDAFLSAYLPILQR